MHKCQVKIVFLGICALLSSKSFSQSPQALQQIENLLSDALFFSGQYLTPATDAAIYQASSAWVLTPQKKKLWDVSLSLHTNVFFVPKSNRTLTINNSDFSFFTIEGGATSALVPTALGDDSQIFLTGQIEDGENSNTVRLETPQGIDAEVMVYPYLQGSVGLLYGTELTLKYSTKVKLKHGNYQVYGAGFKHNLSQYFEKLEAKNLYLSAFAGYSKEEISFNFLDTETTYGSLGLNEISGKVDTWQFQVNGSKKWNKFELMTGLIANTSAIEYEVGGPKGEIESVIPVQAIINKKLVEIYADKTNFIGEVSARYQLGSIFLQSVTAFGKFINTNLSVQYEF
ncbi:MAG TPA: DUF6588 family protein [Flavobacterium sp.]|jgi:hypothetical protein